MLSSGVLLNHKPLNTFARKYTHANNNVSHVQQNRYRNDNFLYTCDYTYGSKMKPWFWWGYWLFVRTLRKIPCLLVSFITLPPKGLIVMPKWTKTKALAIRIQCISLKVRKRMEAKTNIHCGWILSCIWFTRTKKFATCYFPIIFLIGTFVIWPTLIFWVLLMGSIISQLLCFFFFINFTNTTFDIFLLIGIW